MSDLSIKIFADGADLHAIQQLAGNSLIKGFTTNPSLMKKAGVLNYRLFAAEVLDRIRDKPVSFEVFADDFPTMQAQARELASWGKNIYVKVPVSNTKGESSAVVIERLSHAGIKLNVTAVFTPEQVHTVAKALCLDTPAIVSVFAGRIADTGRNPVTTMRYALEILTSRPKAELLWASPREVLNVYQADLIGCHIITVTPDQLAKLALADKDLDEYSRETVAMFHNDATSAGYEIKAPRFAA